LTPPLIAPHLALYREVCQDQGWTFELLDRHCGQLARISVGDRSFAVAGGRACVYPINAASAADLARDKAHALTLLRAAGIAVPRTELVFLRPAYRAERGPGHELDDAPRLAAGLDYPLIVKPNDGARGHLVAEVADAAALTRQLARIAPHSPIAQLQEPLTGEEWRLFVLDGRVRFAYRRTPPRLLGDGRQTLGQLLAAYNSALAARALSPLAADTPSVLRSLAAAGLSQQTVLAEGDSLALPGRRNLAAGGGIADYTESITAAVEAWAARAAAALGLRVAGLDLFAPDLAGPAGFTALELNANPSLLGIARAGHQETALAILAAVCRATVASHCALF